MEGLGTSNGPGEATKTVRGTRKEQAPKAEQKRPNCRVGNSRRVADPVANNEGGRRKRYDDRKGREIDKEKERRKGMLFVTIYIGTDNEPLRVFCGMIIFI